MSEGHTAATLRRWLIPEARPVVVSYSGGNASAYGVRCVIRGIIPRPDRLLVLFADTGSEKQETYRHVDAMEALCAKHDIEFKRCSAWLRPPRAPETWAGQPLDTTRSKLHDVLLALPRMSQGSRIDQPPLFVRKNGGYRGQVEPRCTRHLKIRPMGRIIKAWSPVPVTRWIGYTTDEAHRAPLTFKHQQPYEAALRFPPLALGRSRADVHRDTLSWTGELAPWSACVCCPYNDVARVRATVGPDRQLQRACDEAIRDASSIGITDGPAFLSDRLVSIRQLQEGGDPQPMLPGLEGCDGGYCSGA